MVGLSSVVSGVGAGSSQVRPQSHVQSAAPKDLGKPIDHARAATLMLIQQALSSLRTTGHDLDVLA